MRIRALWSWVRRHWLLVYIAVVLLSQGVWAIASWWDRPLGPPSQLRPMRATHALPFPADGTAVEMARLHDQPGVSASRSATDEGHLFGATGALGKELVRGVPWWLVMAVVAVGIVWKQRFVAVLVALCVSFGILDLGVAIAGIGVGLAVVGLFAWRRGWVIRQVNSARVIGRGIYARSPRLWAKELRTRPVPWGLGSKFVPGGQEAGLEAAGYLGGMHWRLWLGAAASWALWALLYTVPIMLVAMLVTHPKTEPFGDAWLVMGAGAAWLMARVLELLLTRTGRRLLRMKWARMTHREYWPTAVLYAPLLPLVLRLSARHGLTAFTCCNPGIGGGGGMIGESKRAILEAMNGSARVLPAEYIGAGPDPGARARHAIDELRSRPELGGFPAILKPDAGQRGFAVKLARTEADIGSYFGQVTTPVLVQRFHPGPHECGVLWVRRQSSGGAAPNESRDGLTGWIYSVTRKEFPVVVGDGRRTLEELVWRHPRFRNQAAVFLERFADERDRVPAAGETVRLAQSGNHCQGTLFRDGADLISPELEREIDCIARDFAGGLDMGRFDLRYESEEALRRGEGFGIVELNGTAGESTNIYDPERSIAWCYRVLGGQCRVAYELGAKRKKEGVRGMSVRDLLAEVRRQARERRGSEVAD